jgi:predicted  nucleic acid-binding Zn-ribbon protein
MEKEFQCLNCGVEFGQPEAEQAGGRCPECGADLTQIAGVEPGAAKKAGPGQIISVIIGLLATLVVLFFLFRPGEQAMNVDEMLAEYREADAKTPMMIDQSTRLDRVVVDGKTVTFETTLVNVGSEEADDDLFKRRMRPFLAEKYCNDKSSRRAMESGITYGHEISANDGVLLYTVNIGIDDC